MVTLFVVGYLVYFFVGAMWGGCLLYKVLDDNKTCVACWHLLWIIVWAIVPFTLMIDLRG